MESGVLMKDSNWPEWNKIYDNSCNGYPANRAVNGGFKMCCKTK